LTKRGTLARARACVSMHVGVARAMLQYYAGMHTYACVCASSD
jgi:hypothetical protein